MKATGWKTSAAVAAALLWAVGTRAGDLTPPGPPGSTMHTLEELHQNQQALEARLAALEQRMATDGMAPTTDGMVLIPAGAFQMGDTFADKGITSEMPVHAVTVSAFYMDQYEVTKAKWDEVYAWAITNGYSFDNTGAGKQNSHPVHTVNWYDCVKWANARSQMEGRAPCYYVGAGSTTVYKSGDLDIANDWVQWDADGYRLPTEAEWEKAARGGVAGHRFPWADVNLIDHYRANYLGYPSNYSYDTSLVADYHPAFNDGTIPYTSPVGSFAPNGYGLYDMAGNGKEWCWDWHSNTYYGSSPGTDPRGPTSGLGGRVVRGGGWSNPAVACRAADRSDLTPGSEGSFLGLRLVRAAQ